MNRYLFKSIYRCAMVIPMVMVMLMVGHARASETETATAYTPEDCIECHRTGSEESELQMSVQAYEASAHGGEEITCLDCHTEVVDDEHQGADSEEVGDQEPD